MNPSQYNQVLESGGTLKEPLEAHDFGDSINNYIKNFPFRIHVSLGRVHTSEFKEFNQWCETNLGVKYKDWFLTGGRGVNHIQYTLFLKDTKKSMFLALKYSECIDSTNF